jgi:hypothetical protein
MGTQPAFFTEEEIRKSHTPEFKPKAWEKRGYDLAEGHDRRQWELGEWLDEGVEGLTKTTALKKAMKITGHAQSTLWDFARTFRVFPDNNSRRRELSWSHHKEVAIAKLSDEDRSYLLDRATADKNRVWSIQELRTQVRNLKKREGPQDEGQLFKFQVAVKKATYEFLTLRAEKSRSLKLSQVASGILDDHATRGEN